MAGICEYRLRIISDIHQIVSGLVIERSHIAEVVDYYHYLTGEKRVYDRLAQVFIEATLTLRKRWQETYNTYFPNDTQCSGPIRLLGYIEPEFTHDLRRDIEDLEEDPNLPDLFIWDQHYYGYLRRIYRTQCQNFNPPRTTSNE